MDISDPYLGVIRIEHIVLVALTAHPAGDDGGRIAVSCCNILSGCAVAIACSRDSYSECRSVTARMTEKPVARHVLAVTARRIPELALAAQWSNAYICPFIIDQSDHLRLKA